MTILRQALENGFFEKFVGGDGMKTDALIDERGADNLEGFTTSAPVGADSAGLEVFNKLYQEACGDESADYATTPYHAAFLLALAIDKAGPAGSTQTPETLDRQGVGAGEE